ncbi:hypothetical protein MHYP_G00017610 [Metynnis hypsauchen]
MGWRLPVIFQLQAKLRRMEASSKMCLPLIRAIQDSVQKCFGGMMEDPEVKASAVLLPKFKIAWTEEADVEAGVYTAVRGAAGRVVSHPPLAHLEGQSSSIHDAKAGEQILSFAVVTPVALFWELNTSPGRRRCLSKECKGPSGRGSTLDKQTRSTCPRQRRDRVSHCKPLGTVAFRFKWKNSGERSRFKTERPSGGVPRSDRSKLPPFICLSSYRPVIN